MTAFIGIINKDFAILGTDTLATYPFIDGEDTKLRPRNYSSKTYSLPHFKSVFSVTGTLQLGLAYFNFVNERIIGLDIKSLVNIELALFKKKLTTEYYDFPSGTIYLIGLSVYEKKFKGYKLLVDIDSSLKWIELPDNSFLFKPILTDWENKIKSNLENISYQEFIIELMKIQKKEDERKPVSKQVGIGGQILYTELGINSNNGNFTTRTEIIHEFDEYIATGNNMLRDK